MMFGGVPPRRRLWGAPVAWERPFARPGARPPHLFLLVLIVRSDTVYGVLEHGIPCDLCPTCRGAWARPWRALVGGSLLGDAFRGQSIWPFLCSCVRSACAC